MHTYRERKPDTVFVLVKMERTNSLTMLGRQAAITASRQVGQASARRSLATQHKAKDMWQEIKKTRPQGHDHVSGGREGALCLCGRGLH